MKIGDIVKSRHTGQEYRVVEMNKKHKCAYVCVPINPEKYTFFDDINLDENADYKVCIYEDASKLIYNDESLEKALPKPWESEKNIWLFLQDHQEPKWRKLIRKNHRIQEVWNQRTMLTVPL